jgi:hypothetical protein
MGEGPNTNSLIIIIYIILRTEIWGSHSGDYEQYCRLECDAI